MGEINKIVTNNVTTAAAVEDALLQNLQQVTQANNTGRVEDIQIEANQVAADAVDEIVKDFEDAIDGVDELPKDEVEAAEVQIELWAQQRGFIKGTAAYNEFKTIFFNQIYLKEENKNNLNNVQKMLNLYDMGLVKSNDLQDYFKLVLANKPMNQVISLYKFEMSPNFDAASKTTTRRKYISILLGENDASAKQRQVLSEALTTGRVPITNETLTVSGLDKVLSVIDDPKKETELRLSQVAKQMSTSIDLKTGKPIFNQETYDKYMDKFYDDYYLQKNISYQDLTRLTSIYQSIKVKYPQIGFGEVDVYAQAIVDKIPANFMKDVIKLDMDPDYRGSVSNRDINIAGIFTKYKTGTNTEKQALEQKLKTTLTKLEEERQAQYTIDQMVIGFKLNDTALAAQFDQTLNQWKEAYKLNSSQLYQLSKLGLSEISKLTRKNNVITDQEKVNIFNNLEVYAKAFSAGVSYDDANLISHFEHSPSFTLKGAERTSKLNQYFAILASDDKERRQRLLLSIKYNKIYPSNAEIAAMQAEGSGLTYEDFYPDGGKLNVASLDKALGL